MSYLGIDGEGRDPWGGDVAKLGDHEHTCRGCRDGVYCEGSNDEECGEYFDGYCRDCEGPGPRCSDCGARGESIGHQTCQYPQDHE